MRILWCVFLKVQKPRAEKNTAEKPGGTLETESKEPIFLRKERRWDGLKDSR